MTPFQGTAFHLVTRWPRRWLWYWSWLYHFSALVWTGSFHRQRIFIAGEGVGVESKETERVDVVSNDSRSDVVWQVGWKWCSTNSFKQNIMFNLPCLKDFHFNQTSVFFNGLKPPPWTDVDELHWRHTVGVWDKPVNLEGALAFCSLHF